MRSHKPLLQAAPLPPTLLLPPSDTITIQSSDTINKKVANASPSKNDNITSTTGNEQRQNSSKEDDDDFDIDAYYARLHAIPSGLTPTDVVKKSIVEESTFSEIDLNSTSGNQFDADDGVVQSQGLTSELAQNLSQLPQVLPQVANTVLNSFSNILNIGRGVIRQEYYDPKPNANENVQRPTESVDQYPVHEPAADKNLPPVPLFNTNEFGSMPSRISDNMGSYSLQQDQITINPHIVHNNAKENDPSNSVAGNMFRLNAKKKKIYAPVPGLTLGDYNTNSAQSERNLPPLPPINKNYSPHFPQPPLMQQNNTHTTQNILNPTPIVTQTVDSNISFYDPTSFIQNSPDLSNNSSYIQPTSEFITNVDSNTVLYKAEPILQSHTTDQLKNNLHTDLDSEIQLMNSFGNTTMSQPTQVNNNNLLQQHTLINNRSYHIPTSSITTPILSIRESVNTDELNKNDISPTLSHNNLFPSSVKTKLKAKHAGQYPYINNHTKTHNVSKKSRNSKLPQLGIKDLHNYLGVDSFANVSKDVKNFQNVKQNDAVPSSSTNDVIKLDSSPKLSIENNEFKATEADNLYYNINTSPNRSIENNGLNLFHNPDTNLQSIPNKSIDILNPNQVLINEGQSIDILLPNPSTNYQAIPSAPPLSQLMPSANTPSSNLEDLNTDLQKDPQPVFFNPTAFSNPDSSAQLPTIDGIPLGNVNAPPMKSDNKYRLSGNHRPKYYSGPIQAIPNIQSNIQATANNQNIVKTQENVNNTPVKNFGLDVIENAVSFTKIQNAVTSFFKPNQSNIDDSSQSTYEPSPPDWNLMQNQSYNLMPETVHPYPDVNNYTDNISSAPLFMSSFEPTSSAQNIDTYDQPISEPQFPKFFTVQNTQNDHFQSLIGSNDAVKESEIIVNQYQADANPENISNNQNNVDRNSTFGNIIISNNPQTNSTFNEINPEDYVIEPSTDENADDDVNVECDELQSSLILDSFRFASSNLMDQIEIINRPLLKDDPITLQDVVNSNQFDLLKQTEFLEDQPLQQRISAFIPVVPNIKSKETPVVPEANAEVSSHGDYFYNPSDMTHDDVLTRFMTNVSYDPKNDANLLTSFFDTKIDDSFMSKYVNQADCIETETKVSDDNNVSEDDSLIADNEIRDILSHVNNNHNYEVFPQSNADLLQTDLSFSKIFDNENKDAATKIDNADNKNDQLGVLYKMGQLNINSEISSSLLSNEAVENNDESADFTSAVAGSDFINNTTSTDNFSNASVTDIQSKSPEISTSLSSNVAIESNNESVNFTTDSSDFFNTTTSTINIRTQSPEISISLPSNVAIENNNESVIVTPAVASSDFFNTATSTTNFFNAPTTNIQTKSPEISSLLSSNEAIKNNDESVNFTLTGSDFFNTTTSTANFFNAPSFQPENTPSEIKKTDNVKNNDNSVPLFTFFSSMPSNTNSFNL